MRLATLGKELIKVSYHTATCGGDRYSGNGDIIILAFHMTLQDHVTKGSRYIMVRSPSRLVIILASFVVIGIV